MSLFILLLALSLVFGGGGFCCGGPPGSLVGLMVMLLPVGRFAIGLRVEG